MLRAVDLSRVRTIPLRTRENKVALDRFADPPRPNRTCAEFVDSLPAILAGSDFRSVVDAIVAARRNGRPVIFGLGAHVVKCGLNLVLIDLMRRGVITALAMNGAGAIHDFELALVGETSEDVASGLREGTFGMVKETAELINRAVSRVAERRDEGMGALLGEELLTLQAQNVDYSLVATARRLQIPLTVHVAIGTDIVHMHGSADGAAIGLATFNDFRLFAAVVTELSGGVYINMGSAVLLPEVFLKAFTVAQNLGSALHDFVTVNMDMTNHYRCGENVVRRPPQVGGTGYTILGRHEIMIPLLAQAVVDCLERPGNE
jgi:deoxyhypusine synthase